MFDREEPTQSANEIKGIRSANENGGTVGGPLQPANFGLEGYGAQELSLDNIVNAFTYQPMHSGQIEQAEQVREILIAAAKVILRTCPRSPRRTLALQHLVDARMDANCSISFQGRF